MDSLNPDLGTDPDPTFQGNPDTVLVFDDLTFFFKILLSFFLLLF